MAYMIDTHCHFASDSLKEIYISLTQAAQAEGVELIFNIAYDPETISRVIEQCQTHSSLFALIGIQPHDAATFSLAELERVKTLCQDKNNKVIGIGEIGLDLHYELSPIENQIPCFEAFLDLSCELVLPVAIHVRDTHALVIERLKARKDKNLTGVIHCFTGTKDEAREFLDQDFYLSIAGITTFKSAVALQEAVRFIPLDRLLIETDSPYLAPVPMRGKINQPAFLKHTCAKVAELKNISFDNAKEQFYKNTFRLFSRLEDYLIQPFDQSQK